MYLKKETATITIMIKALLIASAIDGVHQRVCAEIIKRPCFNFARAHSQILQQIMRR